MTDLRTAAQQALEALETLVPTKGPSIYNSARDALRAALAQKDEPVWMHPWPPVRAQQAESQTLDDALTLPRAMAQAYENGYKAGVAHERERIIQFLREMQRVVGDAHNHYGVAAVRIKEGI